MNEKAILASYDLAVQNGYNKSIDEFKQLLSSNTRALDVSYNLALENGYKKTINDYKVLMGLGEETQATQDPIVKQAEKKKTILRNHLREMVLRFRPYQLLTQRHYALVS